MTNELIRYHVKVGVLNDEARRMRDHLTEIWNRELRGTYDIKVDENVVRLSKKPSSKFSCSSFSAKYE